MPSTRKVIWLGSQDLDLGYLLSLRDRLKERSIPSGPKGWEELIMFTAGGRPYQYKDLDELSGSMGKLPNDIGYFYCTFLMDGTRISLYIDPDRPSKLVLEGEGRVIEELARELKGAFPPSGPREVLHGKFGPFIIWGAVLTVSAVLLAAVILATGEVRPLLVTWVILISGLVGAYLSIARYSSIARTSTMSLGRKRSPYTELVLHFITVALGIVSVIMVVLLI